MTDPTNPVAGPPASSPGPPSAEPLHEPPPEQHHDPRRDQHGDPLRGSRTSGAWMAVVVAAIVLVLLVVFIVQNTQSVQVAYFGWDGRVPLAAALLIATAAGMLVAILAASLRLLQVRHRVKRDRH